jgi:hypothetical protein
MKTEGVTGRALFVLGSDGDDVGDFEEGFA